MSTFTPNAPNPQYLPDTDLSPMNSIPKNQHLTTTTPTPLSQLKCSTAPGKVFVDRKELSNHYESSWHRYNLKRKEANLPVVEETIFDSRVKAALSIRLEKEEKEKRSGGNHITVKDGKRERVLELKIKKAEEMKVKAEAMNANSTTSDNSKAAKAKAKIGPYVIMEDEEEESEDADQEIDPLDDLFALSNATNLKALNISSNIKRLYDDYGFFIPDKESLVDPTGLIGYCHEKVKLGHTCLYCQRIFTTSGGCVKHMRDKGHTMLRFEEGVDMEEFEVFYDYSEQNEEFMKDLPAQKVEGEEDEEDEDDMADGEEKEEVWEDVADDYDESEEEAKGLYAKYQLNLQQAGFSISALGELILPNGKVVGHRGLMRYYNQRFTAKNSSESVQAVKDNMAQKMGFSGYQEEERVSLSVKAGLLIERGRKFDAVRGAGTGGRDGRGVLVSDRAGGFTALSLYRYKAMAKKARNQEDAWRKHKESHWMNPNKWDKVGNRMITGVSVAHAPR